MIIVTVMVMDGHLIVPFHYGLSHSLRWHLRVVLFLREGWDSEAKRNGSRQSNNKLVHGFPWVVVANNAAKRLRQKNRILGQFEVALG
jgi:hypothetical protein